MLQFINIGLTNWVWLGAPFFRGLCIKLWMVFITPVPCSFTNMVHDSIQHWDTLHKTQIYIASPFFLWNIGWSQAEIGHIATNKSTQSTLTAIAVGRVNEYKLACGPSGNFNVKFNTLEKAKFTFVLEHQENPRFTWLVLSWLKQT